MSRRKPQPKSLPQATEDVVWRSRILMEILEGCGPLGDPIMDGMRRLEHALEDYEASRQPTAAQGQLAL